MQFHSLKVTLCKTEVEHEIQFYYLRSIQEIKIEKVTPPLNDVFTQQMAMELCWDYIELLEV